MFPKTAFALSVLLVVAGGSHAAGLDEPSAGALADTLRGLTPGATGAPTVDSRLGSLGNSQELYDVAGQVLTELTERYGSDPGKMSEALTRGKSDPEGFVATLSPGLRARLKALADKAPPGTP